MLIPENELWKDWERQKTGGILCINEAIITTQKKMFREAISAIGNKLLRGDTSVLNISLPVAIFRKESHLQTVARNLSFCPLFFERPNSPLERVKFATLFAISAGTLGISMEKPFNPILG
jgi:hypothetical protein